MLNYILHHEPGHKCFYEEHSAPKYPRLATLFCLTRVQRLPHYVCGFFCSKVKYHYTNFCFTDTFRGTAVSVVSCLSKRGYYLQQRVHPPLTPVISHPEVRLST